MLFRRRERKILTHTTTWMNFADTMLRPKSLSLKINTSMCLLCKVLRAVKITCRKWDSGDLGGWHRVHCFGEFCGDRWQRLLHNPVSALLLWNGTIYTGHDGKV